MFTCVEWHHRTPVLFRGQLPNLVQLGLSRLPPASHTAQGLKIGNPVYGFCRTIKLESNEHVPIVSFGIVAQLTNCIPRRKGFDALLLGHDGWITCHNDRF